MPLKWIEMHGRFTGLSGITFLRDTCGRFFDCEAMGLYGMDCIIADRRVTVGVAGKEKRDKRSMFRTNPTICYLLLSTTHGNDAL